MPAAFFVTADQKLYDQLTIDRGVEWFSWGDGCIPDGTSHSYDPVGSLRFDSTASLIRALVLAQPRTDLDAMAQRLRDWCGAAIVTSPEGSDAELEEFAEGIRATLGLLPKRPTATNVDSPTPDR